MCTNALSLLKGEIHFVVVGDVEGLVQCRGGFLLRREWVGRCKGEGTDLSFPKHEFLHHFTLLNELIFEIADATAKIFVLLLGQLGTEPLTIEFLPVSSHSKVKTWKYRSPCISFSISFPVASME